MTDSFDSKAYAELDAKFSAAVLAADVPTILALSGAMNKAKKDKERSEYESRSGERMTLSIEVRDAITAVVTPFLPRLLALQSDARVAYNWTDFTTVPTIACFKAKAAGATSDGGAKTMPPVTEQKRDERKTTDMLASELGGHMIVEDDGKSVAFAEGITIREAHAKYSDNNQRHQLRKLLLKLADAS